MANPFNGTVDLDTVALSTGGFRINGEGGGTVGKSVAAAGDLNGDGLADLVVGDPRVGYSTGAAYVVYGSTTRPTGALDLGTLGSAGFKLSGQGGLAGWSLAGAGDVNGDSFADLIVGEPENGGGVAHVVFGRSGGFSGVVDVGTIGTTTPGLRIVNAQGGEQAGFSVSSAGDINQDGYADLLIGVPKDDRIPAVDGDPSGGADAGAAYVIYGKANFANTTINLDAAVASGGGFKVQGVRGGDYTGFSVSRAGDINGDGFADLLVGARASDDPTADPNTFTGLAYVVLGRSGGLAGTITDIESGSGGYLLLAGDWSVGAGRSVSAAGDVNGDGIDDFVVGAPLTEDLVDINGFLVPDPDVPAVGAAYVVFGALGRSPAQLEEAIDSLDRIAGGVGGFIMLGEGASSFTGNSVSAAGDVNGDGLGDVIVGAYGNSNNGGTFAGAAYVVFGRFGSSPSPIDLAAVAQGTGGFKIQGEDQSHEAGTSVSSAGDIDGDGFDDLLVGGGQSLNAAYVIYGKPDTITAQADSAGGTSVANTVDLLGGDDWYDGKAGNDDIRGNSGNDTLRGNVGADRVRGDGGDDLLVLGGNGGPDAVAASGATLRNSDMVNVSGASPDAIAVNGRRVVLDILDGGDGSDTVVGSIRSEVVAYSAPGSAVFAGQNASARIVSVERFELGAGDDALSLTTASSTKYTTNVTALGGTGNDTLWTGSGADTLNGENGNDYLVGGFANDILTGGAGNDLFGFSRNFGTDIVTDFTQGQDKLRIKGFGTARDSLAEIASLISSGADFDGAVGNDTRIDLSTQGTTIILGNFTGSLTAADFQFVT